jgi:DNA-binding transcriptional MocR family regulator
VTLHHPRAHTLQLWPPGLDERKLLAHMSKNNCGGIALSACYFTEPKRRGIMLGFANTTEAQQHQCSARLGQFLRRQYGNEGGSEDDG